MPSPSCPVPSPATRWLRGSLPGRNPLRRTCDRVQSVVSGVLVAALLVVVPLVAVLTDRWAARSELDGRARGRPGAHRGAGKQRFRLGMERLGSVGRAGGADPLGRPARPVGVGTIPVPAGDRRGSAVRIWIGRGAASSVPRLIGRR
jgi:hypothetical protein